MINLKNNEHASAAIALVVGGIFTFLSFYNTDPETYLFPRILAIAIAILSVCLFISSSAGKSDTTSSAGGFGDIWHGLLIGLIFLLVMEDLGFYTSSFLAFLSILLLYGKREITDKKALLKKVMVSFGFMLILYALFWQGLNVRTPTGLLF